MRKEVQVYILELLRLLKEKIASDMNHNIQIGKDGRLWLWLAIGDEWQSIIFDENYEDKEPEIIVNEIIDTLKEAGY